MNPITFKLELKHNIVGK